MCAVKEMNGFRDSVPVCKMHGKFLSVTRILKGALSGLGQFLATEILLKTISPQKLFSISRYLHFCLELLIM